VFGAEAVFALSALEPGRDYELAVYAVNAKGRSEPPVIIPRVRVSTSMERLTKTGKYCGSYQMHKRSIAVSLSQRERNGTLRDEKRSKYLSSLR
jgi:hypothetical protein